MPDAHIEPPTGGGPPEHLREHLERFARGCVVCGAMQWRVLPERSPDEHTRYGCGCCGNVFDAPLVEEADNA